MVNNHLDREREETRCRHMGYSFRLAARVLLYATSHREDNTYHCLCYTSLGTLAGTRNSSMGPLHEGSIWRPIAPWANGLTIEQAVDSGYCWRPSGDNGVGTDVSLLHSNGMTSRFSCGETVLQMLAQNKAILSWCGDSGTTTARAIVGVVGDAITPPWIPQQYFRNYAIIFYIFCGRN